MTVQRIYRGWVWFGVIILGAMVATATLAFLVRHERRVFVLVATALACIIGSQIVFWSYTFPANQITNDWTRMPEAFEAVRRQWEYSHAVSAGLNFAAPVALVLAVLARGR